MPNLYLVDDDDESASRLELTQFFIGSWNFILQSDPFKEVEDNSEFKPPPQDWEAHYSNEEVLDINTSEFEGPPPQAWEAAYSVDGGFDVNTSELNNGPPPGYYD